MTGTDFLVLGIVLIIIAAAVIYIVRAKKSGVKCIGCPAGGSCSGNCGGHSKEQGECNCPHLR